MSTSDSEAEAFLAWIKAVTEKDEELKQKIGPQSSRPLLEVEDLCDGSVLLDVLATIDPQLFRNPHPPGGDAKDNWVLKMGTLKRLYKLIIQYYSEELGRSISDLPKPDLEEIARNSSTSELNKLCTLVIGITVDSDSPRKNEHVEAMQSLGIEDQRSLMIAVQTTMQSSQGDDSEDKSDRGKDGEGNGSAKDDEEDEGANQEGDISQSQDGLEIGNENQEDTSYIKKLRNETLSKSSNLLPEHDHNHDHHSEASKSLSPLNLNSSNAASKEFETRYNKLLEENTQLTNSLEDTQSEKKEIEMELKSLKLKFEEEKSSSNEIGLRKEVERLKIDLRRTEDAVLEAETEVERLSKIGETSGRKIEELQKKSDEAARLKDQVDELKPLAEKAQRNENVIDKYKKKLEEAADVKRQMKVMEGQNAELVDKNAALEDEYKRVAQFKPLMDSYKSQISELEGKASNLQRDLNSSRYETEQAVSRLRASEDSRAKEKEEMELYQDRIKELEYGANGSSRRKKKEVNGEESDTSVNGAEGLVAADESLAPEDDSMNDDDDLDPDLTGELDDALKGTTMTDLKIRVRKLARELEAAQANKADVSRILVLENLLDDSNRMKTKYENDYLKEHQGKLVLMNELETIRNGKSSLGDGPEAALALRRRLNETVEEIDELKKELTSLKVKSERMEKELTIAKSDLTLVNKDQLDILQSLRSSVDVEKQGLESTVSRIREELNNSEDRNKMLMAQVNGLLMEKVDLQSEGIGHREEALKRERNLGELRASLAGKALPKEAEDLLTGLQSSNQNLESQLKAAQDKLQKARQFIRQQDRLLKEKERQHSGEGGVSSEVVKGLEQQITNLKREQSLMSSAYTEQGVRLLISLRSQSRSGNQSTSSSSWLAQQRKSVASGLAYTSSRR